MNTFWKLNLYLIVLITDIFKKSFLNSIAEIEFFFFKALFGFYKKWVNIQPIVRT